MADDSGNPTGMEGGEGNVFPGNWDVVSETLLKTYELWFPQNWSPVDLPWEECDAKNFSGDEAVAQAYWLSKLALFEKSGIGAFGAAAVQAATHGFEDPTKKFLTAVAFDECRHDEVCRRACSRVCPNFPYRFKPQSELETAAHRNILALYENGRRYWSAFQQAWGKYPLELIFSSFFFAEIGAQLIFKEVGERSTNKVYAGAFKQITRDESRHLTGTLAMLERLAERMDKDQKTMISRQLKHGFIYLSPLLFKPMEDFWQLPGDFFEYDQRLEHIAYRSGLGVPKLEERAEAWMQAILRHRSKIEELGIPVPEIKEIGIQGLSISTKKGDDIIATPL
jgi:rubrerythrin